MINYDSPVSVYRQVAAILRKGIESGQYPPATRLPSINDLVQTYGIARLTANKALRLLVTEGLAEKSEGSGFWVKSPDA
jgi:DNA-binding GntR family transcriptional regulator